MEKTPVLESGNIRLRPPNDRDIGVRLALGHDPEVVHMFGISRQDVRPLTQEGAERWARNLAEHPHGWVIESGGSLTGEIRLDHVDFRDSRASMAVGLFKGSSLGRGIGSAAIMLVLDHAFNTLKLHRIGVRVLAYNTRAIRAYEKCGFRSEGRERETAFVEGRWHDDIMLGLLDYEFRPA